MYNHHSEGDAFTARKQSPWPLVGGFLIVAGLVSTLLIAFGN